MRSTERIAEKVARVVREEVASAHQGGRVAYTRAKSDFITEELLVGTTYASKFQ
jgi:hypothetical protein